MNIKIWHDEWPIEPGWYWFYGWISTFDKKNCDPEMRSVRVRKISNGVTYIADGQFLFKGEGAVGQFCKASVPSAPESEAVAGVVEDEV